MPDVLEKKEGREICLKFLFCQEFNDSSSNIDQKVDLFKSSFKASDGAWEAATEIIDCVYEKKSVIDETFKSHLQNWSIERVSLTDKNILRIATAEIMFLNTPHQVAIHEAITLGKRFSTLESISFLNGVLDALAKTQGVKEEE